MSSDLSKSGFYKEFSSKNQEVRRLHAYIKQLELAEQKITEEFNPHFFENNKETQKTKDAITGSEKKREQAVYYDRLDAKNDKEIGISEKIKELEKNRKSISIEVAKNTEERGYRIKSLLALLKSKEEENKKLSEKLDKLVRKEKEYENLKNAVAKRSNTAKELIDRLIAEIEKKNSAIERFQNVILDQEKINKQLENQSLQHHKRFVYFETLLKEKDLMRQNLEQSFNQQFQEKKREMDDLRHLTEQAKKRELDKLSQEIEKLKTEISAKESEVDNLASHYADLKNQNSTLIIKLRKRQKFFAESEAAYNHIIRSIQEHHEARVRELIQKNSEQELILKSELEKVKAHQKEAETIAAEKQNRIDEALMQFSEASRKLMTLKESSYVNSETIFQNLKKKENSLKRREILLARFLNPELNTDIPQQTAIASHEKIFKTDPKKLKQTSLVDPARASEASTAKDQPSEKDDILIQDNKNKPKQRNGVFQQAKPKSKLLPDPVRKN